MIDKKYDPKGLMNDSFAIDGITLSECRSIFVDWALSAGEAEEVRVSLEALIAHYGAENAEHPMLDVLREGLSEPVLKGRRGGWAGRRAGRV